MNYLEQQIFFVFLMCVAGLVLMILGVFLTVGLFSP